MKYIRILLLILVSLSCLILYYHILYTSNVIFHAKENTSIIVWWTPFTGLSYNKRVCNYGSCIFTENRSFVQSSHDTKAILFYGSDFSIEDLPLPRKEYHWWGLLHEESPKNQPLFDHEEALSLFNLTSTFRRGSSMPLTLQYLQSIDSLTSKHYFVSTNHKNMLLKENHLSPILYLQSDCNPPSKRDDYVKELAKFIPVDSYGSCLNNKELPSDLKGIESMNHPELLKLIAKYKFTLSLENAECEDYITEKLWRPLTVGSVPIYWGSPSVARWIPNNESIVHVRDFSTPQQLANYVLNILSDDTLYEKYLSHKLYGKVSNTILIEFMEQRTWGINEDQEHQGTFVDAFECFICDQISKFHNVAKSGSFVANKSHYGCPIPKVVLNSSSANNEFWEEQWHKASGEAHVLNQLILTPPGVFSSDDFYGNVISYLEKTNFFRKHGHEEF
ncbi:Alpha-(1,4)-fucosyltransferase [Armadillidium nasatum]|uniref:Fucosyltransferase n=1 Tax=Armadillidium nasatum TaxID=96803 RepID=A0A5N5T5N1_9CRUS|nr:Alpha-(1,4)-fucosyltransferase [Armadillidium nasatum]